MKIVCDCGNYVELKNEVSIDSNNCVNSSEMAVYLRENYVKILCDKCGELVFISK